VVYLGYKLKSNQYVRKSGTSMATPVVAGAASLAIALLKSRGIHPLPEQIEVILERGSPSRDSYKNLVKEGRYLDLKTLVDFINLDLNITPETTRDQIAGRIQISNFSPLSSPNLRSGETLNLGVELTPDSSIAVEYKWFKNNIPQETYRHPNFVKNYVGPNDAGIYHVEVSSGKTKAVSGKIQVTIDGNSSGDPIDEASNCSE
jgi:subtilisin family serine protease